MYNPKDEARSSKQQYTYLMMRYRRSYPPLHHLLSNTRAAAAEVLIKMLIAYREIDTATTAVKVILIANIIVTAILMRNMREILIRDI